MESLSLTNDIQQLSRLGLGGCPFGGHGWGSVDDQQSIRAIRRAHELGVNFFDTADVYGFGHSERILRDALGTQRHSVHIATKFGVRWDQKSRTWKDSSPNYLRRALEASLQRLGLERVALYYLHWHDLQTPFEKTIEALEKLRQAGKIRAIGLSNVTAQQLRTAVTIAPIATVQMQFSLVNQKKLEQLAPVARQLGIRLTTWGSLAQGLLSGKYDDNTKFRQGDRRLRYENFQGEKWRRNLQLVQVLKTTARELGRTPTQIALRCLLDTSPVGFVLFGAKTFKQVEENVGALNWHMPCKIYRRLMRLGGGTATSEFHDSKRNVA